MLLLPKVKGQYKPAGVPKINWSHPLAKGLLFYVFDTGLGTIVELVKNTPSTISGTVPSVVSSPWGSGFSYNASASIKFVPDAEIIAATTGINYSFAAAYNKTGTVGSYTSVFLRDANNGGSQPYINWRIEINNAGSGQDRTNVSWCTNLNVEGDSTAKTGLNNNTYHTIVGVMTTVPAGNVTAYADGAQFYNVNTAVGHNNTNSNIYLGYGSFVGLIYYAAFWGRVLTVKEQFLLHYKPYDFLIFPANISLPVDQEIYNPNAAPIDPGLFISNTPYYHFRNKRNNRINIRSRR